MKIIAINKKLIIFICILLACIYLIGNISKTTEDKSNLELISKNFDYKVIGNMFDNCYGDMGYIDVKNGADVSVSSDSLKRTMNYYRFNEGTLYFTVNKVVKPFVIVLYDSDKHYTGYHSFNDVEAGQIQLINDGYFRIYTDKNYDGLCYLSNNVPEDVIDYNYIKEFVVKDDRKKNKVVNLGDSIFGNTQDYTSISAQLEKMDGNIYYNCGLGGTELACRDNKYWSTFSATEIIDSICSHDFEKQENALNSGIYFPSYFYDTLDF